jgi:hypothetical protein
MHSDTTIITPAVDDGIDRTPSLTPRRIRPRKLDRLATRTAVNAPRGLSARQWRETGKLLGPSRGSALKPARAGDPVPFFRGVAMSEAIAKAAKYADKPVSQRRARINAAKREAERIIRDLNRQEGAAA